MWKLMLEYKPTGGEQQSRHAHPMADPTHTLQIAPVARNSMLKC